MTQLNTPYPATAYLTGFLRLHEARVGFTVAQADPALMLFLRLFCRAGLERAAAAMQSAKKKSAAVKHFLAHAADYAHTVDATVRFLQGRDPGLALRIVSRAFLPEGPRFAALTDETLDWGFGALGLEDRARHL